MRIGNKTFMNLQEAVGWLLENNALPFQSTANYVGSTEIAMSTLINPSPAKVRVGSIIFFADSKVSTVVGVTSNSFIVSDQYNDLVDDVVYVSNVAINASGHLIVTLSNNTTIDAGLIKQVSNFSINGSQHLIVTYNDGSTTDLGAIFNGNISISGNLTVTGGISGNAITGNSIIETMTGYSFSVGTPTNMTIDTKYAGVCKNGNKLTFVYFGIITRTGARDGNQLVANFTIPQEIADKLYPVNFGQYQTLNVLNIDAWEDFTSSVQIKGYVAKSFSRVIQFLISTYSATFENLTLNTPYTIRLEQTFLLSDNLAS